MSALHTLPARLDLPAAAPLAADLLAHRGGALTLDAQGVAQLGTPGLQVLLAARDLWARDAQSLALSDPSPAFLEQLEILGLSQSDLETPAGEV